MTFEEKLEEGLQLLHEGDFDHSLDIARDLQKMEPDEADGYRLEALVMQKLNQWEPSQEVLDKAIELEPNNSAFYNLRGFAHMQMESLEQAKEDFEKAIDLDDSPAAHRNLVLYHIMNDEVGEGINYLLERIREHPKDVENWIMMGDIMQRAGQTDKARTYYQQAEKMDPENEYVKNQLSEI